MSGLLRSDEVASATGFELPSRGVYETVGGLLMQSLGRVPVERDVVTVGDTTLTVVRMDGRRVDRVLVARRAAPAGEKA